VRVVGARAAVRVAVGRAGVTVVVRAVVKVVEARAAGTACCLAARAAAARAEGTVRVE
jgi:hypothetical protein